MTDTTNDDLPADGPLRLLPNGTVQIDQDGETWVLRRPKHGQFKELKSKYNAVLAFASATYRRKDELVDVGADEIDKIDFELTDLRAEFVALAFKLLSDKSAPAEFDSWLTTGNDVMKRLVNHWQTVPLARG